MCYVFPIVYYAAWRARSALVEDFPRFFFGCNALLQGGGFVFVHAMRCCAVGFRAAAVFVLVYLSYLSIDKNALFFGGALRCAAL